MGTGGARCGAGRPGHRLKAEQTLKVDMRIWRKLGYLVNGHSFAWQWSRGDEATANIPLCQARRCSESLRPKY